MLNVASAALFAKNTPTKTKVEKKYFSHVVKLHHLTTRPLFDHDPHPVVAGQLGHSGDPRAFGGLVVEFDYLADREALGCQGEACCSG